jgi:isopentenyldiphosphate isomerase
MTEEMIDIVNEKDEVVGVVPRTELSRKNQRFRAVRILVSDKAGNLLVQKRSKNKDIYPEMWEIGVAGTVASGENYETAASRELKEEVGLKEKIYFRFELKLNPSQERAFYRVYACNCNGKIRLQKEEVDEARFLSHDDVKKMISKEKFTPPSILAFTKYLTHEEGRK